MTAQRFSCLSIPVRYAQLSLLLPLLLTAPFAATVSPAQAPSEPVDVSPLNGESYYLINQLSGLQADLAAGSSSTGQTAVIENRSFTSLSQRWAMTRLTNGLLAISNLSNGQCLSGATSNGIPTTVVTQCALSSTAQQWALNATSNGYNTLINQSSKLALDVSGSSSSTGATITQIALSSSPTQSQQWLLRPAFFRGIDNALLEKQEADRLAASLPWWQDAGKTADQLQILKNHGVNLVRIRPTSTPPYQTLTINGSSAIPATCTNNGCYAETDAADIDLAKRAKQLGLSVELTLFFDGSSSQSTPGEWAAYSLPQLESAVYNHVKAEIESYRSAGVMPDMVTIGNEVDTGLFGTLASPGDSFTNFAAVEQQGMQAILDAASDTALGPAIPAPLRCIHITPAWDLTSFFTEAKKDSIPFDAICQSYYPMYHGPLTAAQASTSNPYNKPIEQSVLVNAANSIGVPIFLIEVGEHYENGFSANDPWYPPTVAGQRQFLIDVNSVLRSLPNNLGMGFEYWNPDGVNTTSTSGGYTNGDGKTDATFVWNGLTLFDNADTAGSAQATAANYSAILGGADALGGKLDPTLHYMLVNVATGQALGTAGIAGNSGTPLATQSTDGGATLAQQWSITSNGDGFLTIANLNVVPGASTPVLDSGGTGAAGSAVVLNNAQSGAASQEWNLMTAGGGDYTLVNKSTSLVLTANATSGAIQLQAPESSNEDWITPVNNSQLWQVVPIHITETATPAQLNFVTGLPTTIPYGTTFGTVEIEILDASGSPVLSGTSNVTLTISGSNHFANTLTATSTNGIANFDLSGISLGTTGTYTLTAASTGTTIATATFSVTPAVLNVAAQNAARAYGEANPALAYSITGFVNGDSQSAVSGAPMLTTNATTASAPGAYAIAIAAGTLAAANYTFTLTPGTLTIDAAPTTTTLSNSSPLAYPEQNVTLTASVTSTSTIPPSGSVNFMSAATVLGTGALNTNGVATYTGTIQPGVNSLTAVFTATADFASSTSATVTITEPDYSLSTSQSSLNLSAGGSGTVSYSLTPVGGYQGTVTMSCTSTLPSLNCAFSPATYSLTGANSPLTGTATITAASTAAALRPASKIHRGTTGGNRLSWLPGALLLLLLPFASKRRAFLQLLSRSIVILSVLLLPIGITSCGGGGAASSAPPQATGTVTITATGSTGNLVQTLKISVSLQ